MRAFAVTAVFYKKQVFVWGLDKHERRLSEDREVYAAIAAVLFKAWVSREIVVLTVLKDEHTIGCEQVVLEYEVGKGVEFGQRIRRVGKDEVELLVARLEKTEHVATYENVVFGIYLLHTLGYEACVVAVFLYAHHFFAAS